MAQNENTGLTGFDSALEELGHERIRIHQELRDIGRWELFAYGATTQARRLRVAVELELLECRKVEYLENCLAQLLEALSQCDIDAVDRALARFPVKERAAVLLRAYYDLGGNGIDTKPLFESWWASCEPSDYDAAEALWVLRDLGYVGDPLPEGTLTVYRVTDGGMPDDGSWTLSLAVAKQFGEAMSGDSVLWAAEVESQKVLAYFVDRGEEVLVLDGAVQNVTQMARMAVGSQ